MPLAVPDGRRLSRVHWLCREPVCPELPGPSQNQVIGPRCFLKLFQDARRHHPPVASAVVGICCSNCHHGSPPALFTLSFSAAAGRISSRLPGGLSSADASRNPVHSAYHLCRGRACACTACSRCFGCRSFPALGFLCCPPRCSGSRPGLPRRSIVFAFSSRCIRISLWRSLRTWGARGWSLCTWCACEASSAAACE